MRARRGFVELLEDRSGHAGRELLRPEAVAAADHARKELERRVAGANHFRERGDDVEIERLAGSTRFLRAIEYRDMADGWRQRAYEMGCAERAEQPHLHETDALAVCVQPRHRFADGLGAGTHHDDDA